MLAEELLDALSAVRRSLRRRAERPAELAELTGAQIELVRLVRRRPGVAVTEAATALRLAPNTVSTLVRRLVDAGIMVRSANAADRRAAQLALAPAVRRRVEAWRDGRTDTLAGALDVLTESERRALARALPVLARLAEELEER